MALDVISYSIASKGKDGINGGNARLVKPEVYASIYTPYNLETNKKFFDLAASCFDGAFLCIEVCPAWSGSGSPWNFDETKENDFESYRTIPSMDQLQSIKTYCDTVNCKIKGIKFHNDRIRTLFINGKTSSSPVTVFEWWTKYVSLVNSVCGIFTPESGTEYLEILNETSLTGFTDTQCAQINTAVTAWETDGYKVGLSGICGEPIARNLSVNEVSAHIYQNCGYKGEKSTAQDVANAHIFGIGSRNLNQNINKCKENNSNIKCGITEIGCLSIWNKFSNPENYSLSGETVDTTGRAQSVFTEGVLKAYSDTELYDFVVLYYVNDNNGYFNTEPVKEVLKRYLNKGGA